VVQEGRKPAAQETHGKRIPEPTQAWPLPNEEVTIRRKEEPDQEEKDGEPVQLPERSPLDPVIDIVGLNAALANPKLELRLGPTSRYSLRTESSSQLAGPIYTRSGLDLAPPQLRLQWGQLTEGYRIERTSAIGIRFPNLFSLETGYRNVLASGRLSPAENQSIWYIQLALKESVSVTYWNDHGLNLFSELLAGRPVQIPFLPTPTDQGDTAGVDIGVIMPSGGVQAGLIPFRLTGLGAHLSIATGVPDREKTMTVGGRTFYKDVHLDEISQGILALSVTLEDPSTGIRLTPVVGVDSGFIGDFFQNALVHRNLDIPEFPKQPYIRPHLSLSVSIPFG